MKSRKAIITISDGHHYDSSHKNGCAYTSVDLSAGNYGGCGGHENEDDIQSAVNNYKDWVIREGDIPVVIDKRINLNRWI